MTTLSVPLSLGLSTFILIHATAVKYNKIRYFKRYVEPLPFFLPVNLISMWAPLLSLTLRLFGNALSGFVIMNIVYYALQNLSAMVFAAIEAPLNEVFIAPFVAWILHLYFDLFSGFIQTTVFLSLTTIYVGQETPDELLD
jgi:F-type H+-transporting ATPase subunit a